MIRTVRLRVYPGPSDGANEIETTLTAVQRYKNKLAWIARTFRQKYRDLRTAAFPDYAKAEDEYENAAAALKELEDKTRTVRAKARKGEKAPPEVAAARAKKKQLAAALKAEREKIDPAALKAVTADLPAEEESAVKAATAEAGLTAPTSYEARQDLQRAKKTARKKGPRYKEPDGSGTIAVQVPEHEGSERILLEALKAADLHPSASAVLRESGRVGGRGKPLFYREDGTATSLANGLCGWTDEEGVYHSGWRETPEGMRHHGYSEAAATAVLEKLVPVRTWADLLAGRIKDVSLCFLPRAEWRAAWPKGRGDRPSQKLPQGEREHGHDYAYGLVSIRVNREGTRALIPVKEPADRLPPLNAQVKQVELHARRLGVYKDGRPRLRYSVLVSVDDPTPPPARRPGVVAVNVGWRPRPDGSVRCGYYVGDDGEHGEITVPREILTALEHADSLRATRDRLFDLAKARLGKFLATLPEHPEWLVEGTRGLPQWRDGRRLERLLTTWRDHRLAGDDEIFLALAGPVPGDKGQDESWRGKHLHLLAWEQDERRKALGRRKTLFRQWGKRLRERYGTLLLEDQNLSKERRRPTVEEGTEKERTPLVRLMNAAAPGELRECLAMAEERGGGLVVRETVPLATQRCAHCESEERWDAAASILHTCRSCGRQVDQDWQNGQNRLRVFLRTGQPGTDHGLALAS